MSLFDIISYLGIGILMLNSILYFKSYQKNLIAFKVFSFYLFIILIIQVISSYLQEQELDNLYLSHYYFIIQFLFLSFFYSKLIKQITLIKVLTVIVIISIIIQFYISPEIYFTFNLFEIIICSLPIVLYSFLFLIQNIDKENKDFLYINSGIFIYILSSTLIFSSGNLMPNLSKSVNSIIWTVNVFLYLVYQILIFVDWYKNFRPKKISSIFVNNE